MAALFAVDDDVPELTRYKAQIFNRRAQLLRDDVAHFLDIAHFPDWLNPEQVDRLATPLAMAVASLDEVLLRLRDVALPGEAEDAEDDPLVLGVEPRVCPQ